MPCSCRRFSWSKVALLWRTCFDRRANLRMTATGCPASFFAETVSGRLFYIIAIAWWHCSQLAQKHIQTLFTRSTNSYMRPKFASQTDRSFAGNCTQFLGIRRVLQFPSLAGNTLCLRKKVQVVAGVAIELIDGRGASRSFKEVNLFIGLII